MNSSDSMFIISKTQLGWFNKLNWWYITDVKSAFLINRRSLNKLRLFSWDTFVLMLPLKWEQIFTEYVYSMITFLSTDIIFIWNRKKGEESKIVERQRESVCERWRVVERGGSISCKTGHWRNVISKMRIGL